MMNTDDLYALFLQHPSVTTDSRNVGENSVFFALRGDKFDGNRFARQALESGAALAVVDDPSVAGDDRYIVVDDALETLQQLAGYHRKKLGIPVIAITGTNGKTTTKELVTAVLRMKFNTGCTKGNLNNHIGVPLTLLSLDTNTRLGVVEMGASHPGEIAFLSRIADPDFGIITNVGKAHLEGFGSLEGVIETKSELYRYLEKKNGTIFLNADNHYLTNHAGQRIRKITYGKSNSAMIRGEILPSPVYLRMQVRFQGEKILLDTKLTGDYNFENVLAAAAVGSHFGISPADIQQAVGNYTPSNSRSQVICSGSNTIILDAYNANPSSMMASLDNLIRLDYPSKTVILGDMLELGDETAKEHQQVVDFLIPHTNISVYLVGSNFMLTKKPASFRTFSNTGDLIDYIRINPILCSMVLIKGSHAIGLEKVTQYIS